MPMFFGSLIVLCSSLLSSFGVAETADSPETAETRPQFGAALDAPKSRLFMAVRQNCYIKTADSEVATAMQQLERFLEYAPNMPVSLQEPLESGPRKYLNKLVSLTCRDGFLEAVKRGTLADYFHNLTGFSIASASELGLDADGRMFGSKIDSENKILNVPDLDIRDSKEICLFNCVVLGDLHIGSHEGIYDVSLDNCFVLGTLSISGNDQDHNMKVNIWNSNCTK